MSVLDTIGGFLTANLNHIIVIFAVWIGGELFLRLVANRVGKLSAEHGDRQTKMKRAATIARLIHGLGRFALVVVLFVWVLRLFNVDPTPIIASAGVVGLAIGFGAQTLVKDFVAGIFLIAENQYGVGDQVTIGGNEGRVECLSIRSTVLRDAENNVIYIPNGSVTTVINKSKKGVDCLI